MTNPTSGAVPRISATVKWYDRAKGFGFLVRDNGSFDIYFREPVLTAVGLAARLHQAHDRRARMMTTKGLDDDA